MNWEFPLYEIGQPIDWEAMCAAYGWLKDMKAVPQDKEWHAEGDVFVHTQMVVEALVALPEFKALEVQDKHILVASALLHDVEKRSTTTTEVIDGKERIVSPKHAKKGEFTARHILYIDIPTPFEIREQIAKLVRLHGLPLWAIQKDDPQKEVIKASLQVNTKLLALLAQADVLGRVCKDKEEVLFRIELFKELCIENNCYGIARVFESDYGRFLYFNKVDSSPDYVPYEDLSFDVIMMSALPGAGKDTFIQENIDLPVLSLDDIRREHKIDPKDKKKNGQVIQMGKEAAKVYMRAKKSFVFNATNITASMRSKWISLFTEYGGRVIIYYVEVPYKKLLKQNRDREYQVPEKVVHDMIDKLEIPTPYEAHAVRYEVKVSI